MESNAPNNTSLFLNFGVIQVFHFINFFHFADVFTFYASLIISGLQIHSYYHECSVNSHSEQEGKQVTSVSCLSQLSGVMILFLKIEKQTRVTLQKLLLEPVFLAGYY